MSTTTPTAREQAIRARLASYEGQSLPPVAASDLHWLLDALEHARRREAARPYRLTWGPVADHESFRTFAAMAVRYAELRQRHASVEATNTDLCDIDDTGLSAAEDELLELIQNNLGWFAESRDEDHR